MTTFRNTVAMRARWWLTAGALLLAACGKVDLEWSEQIRLADGRVLVAERTAKGKAFKELGGPGGMKQAEMSLAVVQAPPGLAPPPPWRAAYVPVLLDYQPSTGTWSLLATFYYCEDWDALGRPPLPYLQYQSVRGSAWKVVPLEARFLDRTTNLLTGPDTDGEPDLVTLPDKELRQRSAAVRYQRILRRWGYAEDNYCIGSS